MISFTSCRKPEIIHSKNLLCLYPGKRTIQTFSLADCGAAMLADTSVDWASLTTPLVCYW